jgi:uncharacterized integral membrane protein
MFLINVAAYLFIGVTLWAFMGNVQDTPIGTTFMWRAVWGVIMAVVLACALGFEVRKREKK